MNIAQVVPLLTTVPVTKYGGIERVVEDLVSWLDDRDNEITVYCAGESTITGKNVHKIFCTEYPTFKNLEMTRPGEINQILKVIKDQHKYDLIHFHYEPKIFSSQVDDINVNLLKYIEVPFISTIHNTTYLEGLSDYYKNNKETYDFNYVFISNNQRQPLKFLPNYRIIYNGIDISKFSIGTGEGDYLAFVGRFYKPKGILEAIEIAKKSNCKLKIAANIPPTEVKFYESEVKPLIDGNQIEYVGEIGHEEKIELFKNAKATLCPVLWEEPFGLVAIESLACGTPVIAFNKGALPEIVKDKETGFIVTNVEEAVNAVKNLDKIDRNNCRKRVEDNFTSEIMSQKYYEYYMAVINK
jgi:glycosyltransferase involved in cell wall biosynthesis